MCGYMSVPLTYVLVTLFCVSLDYFIPLMHSFAMLGFSSAKRLTGKNIYKTTYSLWSGM